MTDARALRERLAGEEPAYGAWCALDGVLSAEIVALAGLDWVCIDLQHGAATLEGAAPAFQAISVAGAAPLARVAGNEHWLIGRALDLGAVGVIVPMVNGPEDAAHAVESCRYPPGGSRSFGPVRTSGTPADPLCIVMCETREGVELLEAACTVPGVDGVYVGPRDLALSYGIEPGPELETAIGQILETCLRTGVPGGIQARSGESARAYTEAGFRFAAVGTDRDLLARAVVSELSAATGSPIASGGPTDGLLRAAARYT